MHLSYKRNIKNSTSISDIQNESRKIVFAPLIFQAIRALFEFNIVEYVNSHDGVTKEAIIIRTGLSEYAIEILLEISCSINVVKFDADKYYLTELGKYLLNNDSTSVNMQFVNDICYQGAFYLKESLENSHPEGLKIFGSWQSIYDGLEKLPEKKRKSWFIFDNHYPDVSADSIVKIVMSDSPKIVYNVGTDSGKFGKALLDMYDDVKLVCIDLPEHIEATKLTVGTSNRVTYLGVDVLIDDLPRGADAIMMGKFSNRFRSEWITHILKKASTTINRDGKLFILEPFIDQQQERSAALGLTSLSVFSACIADGYSKMYNYSEFVKLVTDAGLKVVNVHKNSGDYDYSLLECKKM